MATNYGTAKVLTHNAEICGATYAASATLTSYTATNYGEKYESYIQRSGD